jgi:hypothetical protein
MPIIIKRKQNTNLTWEVNAMFSMAFPSGIDEFEIPRLEYMLYLHKQFELIKATDENGEDLDLTDICNCCRESIRLEIAQKYLAIKAEEKAEEVEFKKDILNSYEAEKQEENELANANENIEIGD